MLSKWSIRNQFIFHLFVASAALIAFFSFILYTYIKQSIYEERKTELIQIAQNISSNESLSNAMQQSAKDNIGLSVELSYFNTIKEDITLEEYKKKRNHFLSLYYPFDFHDKSYLKLSKDITATKQLLDRIFNSIIFINMLSISIVLIYAFTLSRLLLKPITSLTNRLANMNEHMIKPINTKKLPLEFVNLADSINNLINRLQTFVKYQKELFIGAAHELKTPLAVMKLKNEVTLMRKRESEKYIETLKLSNTTINDMNSMISSILNIGRQEGAQLEPPEEFDVIEFLHAKAKDFNLLANQDEKKLSMHLPEQKFIALVQKTLLNQILQNFLQNAIKFTPKGESILLQANIVKENLIIEVIDSGCGIDPKIDLFAPFKRKGDKPGAGLGLFLAKSAADAINAKISIKNRKDNNGAIATLKLPKNL